MAIKVFETYGELFISSKCSFKPFSGDMRPCTDLLEEQTEIKFSVLLHYEKSVYWMYILLTPMLCQIKKQIAKCSPKL